MKRHKWLWDWIPLLLPVASVYFLIRLGMSTDPSQGLTWFWMAMITAVPFALITFIRMCPAPDEFDESEQVRSKVWEQIMDIDEYRRRFDRDQEVKETNIWPNEWY